MTSFLKGLKAKSDAPLSEATKLAIDEKMARSSEPKSHLSRQILQQEETERAIEKATQELAAENEHLSQKIVQQGETERAIEKAAQELATENELLRKNAVLQLNVNDIVVVPGRKRNLTAEEYDDLKKNLANNPLVTPITVFLREDGRYELVSGHNRLQVHIDLGKPTIAAVVQEIAASEVSAAAFYANLLHPSLPDYEKYRGLKTEQENLELTTRELSEKVGISQSSVVRLLTFEALPDSCHVLLSKHPHILGASAARDIKIAIDGGATEERVLAELKRLARGEITMERAVEEIRKKEASPASPPTEKVKATKTPVTFNGQNVCQMTAKPDEIKIKIASPELIKDHSALQKAIADLIVSTIERDAESSK